MSGTLFDPDPALIPIDIVDGELAFMEQFPFRLSNAELFDRLVQETDWRAEAITIYGKTHLQPRLTAWVGDQAYRYSGMTLAPTPWPPLLAELRDAVQAATNHRFNSVLLNYYRDQRDSMGMHSDDEPELGPHPAIASLSYGAARTFILKHKASGDTRKLRLGDGNLLLMAGALQANWRHGINKETRPAPPRLNLTFRYINSAPATIRSC
jgi:alkylated DNA repair dioxygenase AlkB